MEQMYSVSVEGGNKWQVGFFWWKRKIVWHLIWEVGGWWGEREVTEFAVGEGIYGKNEEIRDMQTVESQQMVVWLSGLII